MSATNRGAPLSDVYAVDYESFYSDQVSIGIQGTWHYLRHPEQDIYLVSVYGPKGSWVGNPLDFDWDSISGATWVSHNRSFDEAVWIALKEKHPTLSWGQPGDWHCTSDLAAYCGSGRSLKESTKNFLKVELSKDTRDKMKGQRWSAMTAEFRHEVEQYALRDAKYCWQLWDKLSRRWPQHERELSRLTSEIGWRGVCMDLPKLEANHAALKRLLWETEQKIPWAHLVGTKDEEKKEIKLLSPRQVAKACRAVGIEPPTSLAKDSEELELWLETHGEEHTFVKALSNWRRFNTMCEKYHTAIIRTRVETDGRMGYATKYGGAHTLRWSGDQGFNTQNLQRTPFYISKDGNIRDQIDETDAIDAYKKQHGRLPDDIIYELDMRSCIVAPPGKKFIIPDLSQIEPRVIAWLAGDHAFLKGCQTRSPYQVHAELTMGWKGKDMKKEDLRSYQLAKARLLSLGFGSGFEKFVGMAKTYGVPETVFDAPTPEGTQEEFEEYLQSLRNQDQWKMYEKCDPVKKHRFAYSWTVVNDYRDNNPLICGEHGLWNKLERAMRRSVGGNYEVELPSGRVMTYRQVSTRGGLTAVVPKNGRYVREKFYGGKIAENITQACARDVFAEAKLRLHQEGYMVVLSVHDEAPVEVDENEKDDEILRLMTQQPIWLPGCPIASEAAHTKFYCK